MEKKNTAPHQSENAVDGIEPRFLLRDFLRLNEQGDWFIEDERVEHKGVIRFLQQNLFRNTEGKYWIQNGPQRAFVEIQKTPYFITASCWLPNNKLEVSLGDQTTEMIPANNLYQDTEGNLYSFVKKGQKGDSQNTGHLALWKGNATSSLEPFLQERVGGSFFVHNPPFEAKILPLPRAES